MKTRLKLTQSLPAKVIAFILTAAMLTMSVACVIGAIVMTAQNMYSMSQEEYLEKTYNDIAEMHCQHILERIYPDAKLQHSAIDYCMENNITSVTLTDYGTNKTVWEWKSTDGDVQNYKYDLDYVPYWYYYGEEDNLKAISAEISMSKMNCEQAEIMIDFAYSIRYYVFAIGAAAIIISAVGFVFLMSSSGRRKGHDEVTAGWGTKIPFDLTTAFAVFLITIIVMLLYALHREIQEMVPMLISFGLFVASILLAWSMSFALRIKLGKWWKNTVIYRVISLMWKFAKLLAKNIPLIWKAVLAVLAVTFAELFLMIGAWNSYGKLMMLWFSSGVILGGTVIYYAISFRKLRQGGEALANGDLNYQVDTSKLVGDFKAHGESLNSIAQGMSIAVADRLKSERMKTELITNVSHDIKTPLTSIINYTDLISKEECDNDKITEYSEVLLRQSERLKRLIEDLVEASKASTGNLEVNLEPIDVNILLTQTAGEYEEKLSAKNLEIITTQPGTPVIIRADGRRLWRVFDNLMNNICKYAQSSTRVYLTLERQSDEAVITFRNTSHTQLNISADELMERFVRGDSSRNTEGNGLGLSIAKSLTELQNGELRLSIDGDLFKVTLRFPIIK